MTAVGLPEFVWWQRFLVLGCVFVLLLALIRQLVPRISFLLQNTVAWIIASLTGVMFSPHPLLGWAFGLPFSLAILTAVTRHAPPPMDDTDERLRYLIVKRLLLVSVVCIVSADTSAYLLANAGQHTVLLALVAIVQFFSLVHLLNAFTAKRKSGERLGSEQEKEMLDRRDRLLHGPAAVRESQTVLERLAWVAAAIEENPTLDFRNDKISDLFDDLDNALPRALETQRFEKVWKLIERTRWYSRRLLYAAAFPYPLASVPRQWQTILDQISRRTRQIVQGWLLGTVTSEETNELYYKSIKEAHDRVAPLGKLDPRSYRLVVGESASVGEWHNLIEGPDYRQLNANEARWLLRVIGFLEAAGFDFPRLGNGLTHGLRWLGHHLASGRIPMDGPVTELLTDIVAQEPRHILAIGSSLRSLMNSTLRWHTERARAWAILESVGESHPKPRRSWKMVLHMLAQPFNWAWGLGMLYFYGWLLHRLGVDAWWQWLLIIIAFGFCLSMMIGIRKQRAEGQSIPAGLERLFTVPFYPIMAGGFLLDSIGIRHELRRKFYGFFSEQRSPGERLRLGQEIFNSMPPGHLHFNRVYGEALLEAGMLSEARIQLELAVSINNASGLEAALLGICLEGLGEGAEALHWLAIGLRQINGDSPIFHKAVQARDRIYSREGLAPAVWQADMSHVRT